jgi:hypothetical protein
MYFPLSQIKSNLYTNGEEYVLFTTKEPYKGYYYETSSGKKYTGKVPQDGPNLLLILKPITQDKPFDNIPEDSKIISSPNFPQNLSNIIEVDQINPLAINYNVKNTQNRSLPQYNPTIPTQQNKDLGVFSRYFCKKTNELIYLEINQKTFNQLQSRDPKIAWDLYIPLTTLWYIKGDKEKTYKANKGLISLIEQNQKWYGFSKYLKEDFLKYYSA